MDWISQYLEQLELLKNYASEHPSDNGVNVEYSEAYGKYPCLSVTVDPFLIEMEFRPQEDVSRNEIRTRNYLWFVGKLGYRQTRFFMMKRKDIPSGLEVFSRYRRDYHYLPTTFSTWADAMIKTVDYFRDNRGQFLRLCRVSCPFHEDGTHKYHSWTNYAIVRIVRQDDVEFIQGVKGGETPSGSHVIGGNGSFVAFNRGNYGIGYTVECIAGEKPCRGVEQFVNEDEYLRLLMDKLGRKKMPYDLLNSKLPEKLEVITYDMDNEPESRSFVPVEFDGSWLKLLQECFKDL